MYWENIVPVINILIFWVVNKYHEVCSRIISINNWKNHLYMLMSFHFFIYGKNEVLICLNVEVDHFIIEYICDFITSTLIIWSWWFNWMNRRHYVNIHRIHTTKKRNSKIHSRKTLSFFSSNLNLIHICDFTNIYIYICFFLMNTSCFLKYESVK